MKKIMLSMTINFFICLIMTAQTDTLQVYKGTPTIDGNADDAVWNEVEATEIVLYSSSVDPTPEKPTADDFSGYFKTLWDDDNVYFLIVIKDDILQNPVDESKAWISDMVELYVNNPNNWRYDDAKTADQWTFHYDFTDHHREKVYYTNVQDESIASTANDGWVQEIAIPWDHLLYVLPSQGDEPSLFTEEINMEEMKPVGFGIMIIDKDDATTEDNRDKLGWPSADYWDTRDAGLAMVEFLDEEVIVTNETHFRIADENNNRTKYCYPNFINENLYIKNEDLLKVEVYNSFGQQILSIKNPGTQIITIGNSSLSNGINFIILKDHSGNIYSEKVIKP